MAKNTLEYIQSLFRLLNELKKEVETRCSYKLVGITEDVHKNSLLKIQINGKHDFVTCRPYEIVAHDGFLEGFSKQDIRTITYYATKALSSPTIEILEQCIDNHSNQKSLRLLDKKHDKVFVRSVTEISRDPSLLKKMDQLDAHVVGYAACDDAHGQERREIEKLKELEKSK